MVSKSGAALLETDAVEVLKRRLMPLARSLVRRVLPDRARKVLKGIAFGR